MRSLVFASAVAVALTSGPAWAEPVRDRQIAEMGRRLFPVLTALRPEALPKSVERMLDDRRRRIRACGAASGCEFQAALWTEDERRVLADAAARQLTTAPSDDGAEAQAAREIQGLNGILRVYGLGAAPGYPQIDGPDDPDGRRAADAVKLSKAQEDDPTTALDPSLGLSLALLDVNNRNDAAAFEAAEAGFNALALRRARDMDWAPFPFTALVVLGAGPDDMETPLSSRSKVRLRAAARRFAAGDAPLIIVSGGAVHPRRTRRVEAFEMRLALITRFGVPAEAILVEPYARHTTTNLRNAARLLAKAGAPEGREAVIVSDEDHIATIESAEFKNRNQRELGYQPGVLGRRLSPDALTFFPKKASSRIDPGDPLDP